MAWALAPLALLGVCLPLGIGVFVARSAWPALAEIGPLAFVTSGAWSPTSGRWGMGAMVAGTVVASAGALLLAAPVGLGVALHLRLVAGRREAAVVRGALGVLAGLPSVVVGLAALLVVVPAIRSVAPPGLSVLAAVITLAAMVLPTLAIGADAAFAQVDRGPVAAAHALGLAPVDVARGVLLPLAAPGLRAVGVVALARALGETMALLMVAGNTVAWPTSPFVSFRTLTGGLAMEMAYAGSLHRAALFVAGLLLLGLVSAVALGARR